MRILEEFWSGNTEPTEYDCKKYKKTVGADLQERRKIPSKHDE